MLKDVLKKVSKLLIISAILVPSVSCYATEVPGNGSNITREERIRRLNVLRNLQQEYLQLGVMASLADACRYRNSQELVAIASRYSQADLSQISSNELANIPMSMLLGTIVSKGSAYITNLNIDTFNSHLQHLIRSAEDLHNKFQNYHAQVESLRQ